jgi:hypothetical protein
MRITIRTKLLSVCVVFLSTLTGCHVDFDNEPPDMQTLRESRPIETTKELKVNLEYDIGHLEITKTTDDQLIDLDLRYDRNRFDPKFNFNSGERASLEFDMNSRGFSSGRARDTELALRLSDKVRLDLEISTGVSESQFDMTDLQVERMRLHGGVGKTEVAFDKPSSVSMESFEMESGVGELIIRGLGNARVQRVTLEGGVGRTELDFTGEPGTTTTDCTIKVGVGQVRLLLPRDANVEIQGEGSFLSNINAPSFERDGKTYTHRGDGGAKIVIRVESGVGGVNVELI